MQWNFLKIKKCNFHLNLKSYTDHILIKILIFFYYFTTDLKASFLSFETIFFQITWSKTFIGSLKSSNQTQLSLIFIWKYKSYSWSNYFPRHKAELSHINRFFLNRNYFYILLERAGLAPWFEDFFFEK